MYRKGRLRQSPCGAAQRIRCPDGDETITEIQDRGKVVALQRSLGRAQSAGIAAEPVYQPIVFRISEQMGIVPDYAVLSRRRPQLDVADKGQTQSASDSILCRRNGIGIRGAASIEGGISRSEA